MTPHHPQRLSWTLGNLLLLAGAYLLLFVGGLEANARYEQLAARGDNDLAPAAIVTLAPSAPNAFVVPQLNDGAASPISSPQLRTGYSLLSRIVIPKIAVDSKVIEVGWETIEQDGQPVSVWQVAKYAVGHHRGSANAGDDDNIVLAGHVGGEAPVFGRLNELVPGDQLTLTSAGRQYLYVVSAVARVQEVGVSDEQRLANAAYMAPSPSEQVTLITCWPPSGPNKFDQRIVVTAVPYGSLRTASDPAAASSWGLR